MTTAAAAQQPNRAELFEAMERLDHKIEYIRRHELPNAHLRGGWRRAKRVEERIERFEAEAARIYGQLHEAVTWDDFDSLDDGLLCDYCHQYRFVDRHDRFKAGGICPRCDPNGGPVSPFDPNWHPDYDQRR